MNLELIDTSTTAGKIEVMRLAAEGRKVAMQFYKGVFQPTELPLWNWTNLDYAIIVEPVGPEVLWARVDADGVVIGLPSRPEPRTEPFTHQIVKYVREDLK